MLALLSRCRSVLVCGFGLRHPLFAASLLLLAANAVQAEDYVRVDREAAKSWAMHRIAVIQATAGDVQGAKITVSQIDNAEERKGRSTPIGWGQYDERGNQYFLKCARTPDRVPAEVPRGLPANYLAADPRHGVVVDFTDECDSAGIRATARRYADGYVMIETPHSVKNDR